MLGRAIRPAARQRAGKRAARHAPRRQLSLCLRIVAVAVLLTAVLVAPALGAARSSRAATVRIASAALSGGHTIAVRGTVHPIVRGLRVKLEVENGSAGKPAWEPLGRPVSVAASGRFTVSATLPGGLSAVVIRAVLMRGRVTLADGAARRVPVPAGAVLGVKVTQPPTGTTAPPASSPSTTTTFPSTPSPQPACPAGDTGEFPDCEPPPPSPDKGATLAPGGTLSEGDYLESEGGQYKLIMQGDGNLVLYHEGTALWSSETGGNPGSYAVMQGEGNLVVYHGATVTWNSSTWGFPGAYLSLQSEGNLVIYQDGHPLWDWGSGYLANELNQWKLEPGAYLLSPNHEYELVMQSSDGNLVLYHNGQALWSTQTGGDPGSYAIMQGEGNFVVYDGSNATWNSSTWGFPGANLVLQNEGNLVLYQDGHPIWDWGSGYLGDELNQWKLEPGAYLLSPNHEYELVMQSSDGNLVLYHNGQALWSSQTGGEPGSYAVMQSDGNFVIYKPHSGPWSTGTSGHRGAFLRVQNDSNVVVYDGDTPLWDWGSGLLGGGGGGGGAGEAAIAWARGHLGTAFDDEECLLFVQEAYAAAGVNIGRAPTAAEYWTSNPEGYAEHPGNTSPPVGALVFWGPDDVDGYSNPAGHVGIYVGAVSGYGSDEVISTWSWPEPESQPDVHYFSLSGMNNAGYPYDGWMAP